MSLVIPKGVSKTPAASPQVPHGGELQIWDPLVEHKL